MIKNKNQCETGTKQLAFLDYLIYAKGYNHRKIADKLGCTQQNIHWMFSVVDQPLIIPEAVTEVYLRCKQQVISHRAFGIR